MLNFNVRTPWSALTVATDSFGQPWLPYIDTPTQWVTSYIIDRYILGLDILYKRVRM